MMADRMDLERKLSLLQIHQFTCCNVHNYNGFIHSLSFVDKEGTHYN
jgi:hypothetical protein